MVSPLAPTRDDRPLRPSELLPAQIEMIEGLHALLIGIVEENRRRKSPEAYDTTNGRPPWVVVESDRTHRVIMLEGNRGSGKTSILLTLLNHWCRGGAGRWKYLVDEDRGNGTGSTLEGGGADSGRLGALFDDMKDRVFPLEPVTLDPMPNHLHPYARIVLSLKKVVDWVEERNQPQCLSRSGAGLWGEPTRQDQEPLQQRWSRLYRQALVAWDTPTYKGGDRELDEFALTEGQRNVDWNTLQEKWHEFIDRLVKALDLKDGACLVLPIDDLDLQPQLADALLLAIRVTWHPRLVYLVNAAREHLLESLTLSRLATEWGVAKLERERNGKQFRLAHRLAEDNLMKVVPLAHRFVVPSPSTRHVLDVLIGRGRLPELYESLSTQPAGSFLKQFLGDFEDVEPGIATDRARFEPPLLRFRELAQLVDSPPRRRPESETPDPEDWRKLDKLIRNARLWQSAKGVPDGYDSRSIGRDDELVALTGAGSLIGQRKISLHGNRSAKLSYWRQTSLRYYQWEGDRPGPVAHPLVILGAVLGLGWFGRAWRPWPAPLLETQLEFDEFHLVLSWPQPPTFGPQGFAALGDRFKWADDRRADTTGQADSMFYQWAEAIIGAFRRGTSTSARPADGTFPELLRRDLEALAADWGEGSPVREWATSTLPVMAAPEYGLPPESQKLLLAAFTDFHIDDLDGATRSLRQRRSDLLRGRFRKGTEGDIEFAELERQIQLNFRDSAWFESPKTWRGGPSWYTQRVPKIGKPAIEVFFAGRCGHLPATWLVREPETGLPNWASRAIFAYLQQRPGLTSSWTDLLTRIGGDRDRTAKLLRDGWRWLVEQLPQEEAGTDASAIERLLADEGVDDSLLEWLAIEQDGRLTYAGPSAELVCETHETGSSRSRWSEARGWSIVGPDLDLADTKAQSALVGWLGLAQSYMTLAGNGCPSLRCKAVQVFTEPELADRVKSPPLTAWVEWDHALRLWEATMRSTNAFASNWGQAEVVDIRAWMLAAWISSVVKTCRAEASPAKMEFPLQARTLPGLAREFRALPPEFQTWARSLDIQDVLAREDWNGWKGGLPADPKARALQKALAPEFLNHVNNAPGASELQPFFSARLAPRVIAARQTGPFNSRQDLVNRVNGLGTAGFDRAAAKFARRTESEPSTE